MSYSPMAFNTATAGRAGFVRLGTGIAGQSDGTIVANTATLFSVPKFTGLVTADKITIGGASENSNGYLTLASSPDTNIAATIVPASSGYAGITFSNIANNGTASYMYSEYIDAQTTNLQLGTVGTSSSIQFKPNGTVSVEVKPSGTQSVSTSTGALVVKGGAGVGGNTWVGGELIAHGAISTDNQIFSYYDLSAGPAQVLASQIYTVNASGYTPTTSTWPSTSQFFPMGINLAPATLYEIEYKLWLDSLSVSSSVFYFSPVLDQSPQNWNSYSTSQYSSSNDGSGMRNVVLTSKTSTSGEQAGISYLYAGTPHYIELKFVILTNATYDTIFQLHVGTSVAGGNVKILSGSTMKITNLPGGGIAAGIVGNFVS